MGHKSNTVKPLLPLIMLLACVQFAAAQPSIDTAGTASDTAGLHPQKDNIITENTVIKIENLGASINTPLPELRPTVSADGDLLFFICENNPRNTKYSSVPNSQDIWFSERDSTGKWSKAVHLGYPLNTMQYNAVYWISPDNNRILIRGAFMNGALQRKRRKYVYDLTEMATGTNPKHYSSKTIISTTGAGSQALRWRITDKPCCCI